MSSAVKPRLSLNDLDLQGKRLFVRADFNVPLTGGNVPLTGGNVPLTGGSVADDTRIRETLPTLRLALEKGASLVLASHLGRPKGGPDPKSSLAPVAAALEKLLGRPVKLAPDCVGEQAEALARGLKPGDVLLLENVRWHAGEQGGDESFARRLASLADCYANDAFGTCHRADASVALVPKQFPKAAAGLLIEREIQALGRLLRDPERPFLAVLGGAKVSDKLPVMHGLLPKVDAIVVGGAMAYTLLKAKGVEVGSSRIEADMLPSVSGLLAEAERLGKRILLPVDHVVASGITEADAAGMKVQDGSIEGGMGVDIGPRTRELYAREIAGVRSILWNGPMGVFEVPAFAAGTRAVAEAVASSGAFSVVGGGDSIAALHALGMASRVSHVSTGGGALLELLAGEPMPGLEALTPKA